MPKVINMQDWLAKKKADNVELVEWELSDEDEALFDYVEDSVNVLHDYLIDILVTEGVLPEEYRENDEE